MEEINFYSNSMKESLKNEKSIYNKPAINYQSNIKNDIYHYLAYLSPLNSKKGFQQQKNLIPRDNSHSLAETKNSNKSMTKFNNLKLNNPKITNLIENFLLKNFSKIKNKRISQTASLKE